MEQEEKESLTIEISSDVSKTKVIGKRSRGRPKKYIPIEEIKKYFHLPLNEASRQFNIGETSFKRICREYNIKQWPYRQYNSYQLRECIKRQRKELVSASSESSESSESSTFLHTMNKTNQSIKTTSSNFNTIPLSQSMKSSILQNKSSLLLSSSSSSSIKPSGSYKQHWQKQLPLVESSTIPKSSSFQLPVNPQLKHSYSYNSLESKHVPIPSLIHHSPSILPSYDNYQPSIDNTMISSSLISRNKMNHLIDNLWDQPQSSLITCLDPINNTNHHFTSSPLSLSLPLPPPHQMFDNSQSSSSTIDYNTSYRISSHNLHESLLRATHRELTRQSSDTSIIYRNEFVSSLSTTDINDSNDLVERSFLFNPIRESQCEQNP